MHLTRADGAGTIADLETDSNGGFELPDLPAGEYRIKVSKPNYVPSTVPLRVGTAFSGSFVVRLIRCGVITGHALDAEGQGVRNATVFAMSLSSERGTLRPFARFERGHQARVNENGEYRLFNLPPGEYAVAVTYGASTVVVGGTGGAQVGASGSGVVYYPAGSQPRMFTVSGGEEYRGIDFSVVPGALFRVSGKVDVTPSQSGFWLALTSVNQPAFATAVTGAGEDGSFHFTEFPPDHTLCLPQGPRTHGDRSDLCRIKTRCLDEQKSRWEGMSTVSRLRFGRRGPLPFFCATRLREITPVRPLWSCRFLRWKTGRRISTAQSKLDSSSRRARRNSRLPVIH